MGFFQNVFDQEYQGYLLLADRKLSPTFKVAPNRNPQSKQVAWNAEPYDLSSSDALEFNFCWDPEFRNWSRISISVGGSDPSATTAREVADALNADPTFSSLFTAEVVPIEGAKTVGVSKKQGNRTAVRIYFGNSGAEVALGFNKKAGVAELPEFFARHTIDNRFNFEDSAGMLIRLDETDPVDQAIIRNAGLDPSAMQADWQLVRGRGAGLFTFQKLTVDSSDRITQIIEYPAGSVAGDFARKINYTYTSTNTNPSSITEIPYVLKDADLLTP